jgi:hypothetical protein
MYQICKPTFFSQYPHQQVFCTHVVSEVVNNLVHLITECKQTCFYLGREAMA